MRTLSSEDLHRSDIIQDTESLKKMAVLHESMVGMEEWEWMGIEEREMLLLETTIKEHNL